MKKLIFAAFGVIAFSGVSMANTVESMENNVSKIETYVDCNVWAMNFCEDLNGWSSTNNNSSYKIYREMVEVCEAMPATEVKYLTLDDDTFLQEGSRFEAIH